MSQAYDYTLRSFEAEAAQVVARAREAARGILKEALAEAERLKAQARTDGQQAGFKQGLEQGTAQAQRRVAEETRTLAGALAAAAGAIEARQNELLHQARRELAQLALGAAERIVRARIEADPALVARTLEAALAVAGRRHFLEVRLNPADHQAMARPDTEFVRFMADPAVERGGCLVRAENADVDATIATQLAALREAVLG